MGLSKMNITAGKFKGRKILIPDEKITRPTLSKIRMAVFNTLQAMIDFNEASFLDMFAGSGIMGLEALSRGFSDITAIEINKNTFNILKNNYNIFNLNATLILGDSLKQDYEKHYDVVYIDPPYFSGVYETSLSLLKDVSIVVLEHVKEVNIEPFSLIKQKQYGDKYISYLKL